MMSCTIQPASRIGDLRPYTPPPRDPRIALSLDNNEGAPVDAAVFDLLSGLDSEVLRRYPDQTALEGQIAQAYGVESERVVVTNGGDDAIDRVCRALLNPGDVMLTHTPGFVMIPRWAQLTGAVTRSISWLGDEFPKTAFLESIDETVRLVALISPCNPTGGVVPLEDIIEVAARCAQFGAVLMLDQAYVEFADEDPIERMLDLPNIVFIRTFSKAMGGAGLRVGYAIASERIATWLRTVGGPYPVSSISLLLASALFEQREGRQGSVQQTRINRAALIDWFRQSGAHVFDSQANFVLARFEDAGDMHQQLLDRGISVRRFRNGSEIDQYLRFSVPADESQFNQLLDALGAIGECS